MLREIDLRYPANVVIETTAFCQLRCLMCGRNGVTRKLGNMAPSLVFSILRQIAGWNKESIRVWYCFLGEPLLLRKRLVKYVRFGRSLGIMHHIINTNGNLLDPPISEQLVEAGLTEIYIGVDAATPETYQQIRVGGDFQKVLDNIHYLLEIRPERLQITVQMIEMAANRHERAAFIRYWQELGVRTFVKKELGWIANLPSINKRRLLNSRYPCPWVLDTMGIYWNGDVPFCVNDWNGVTAFGNVSEKALSSLWEEQINRFGRPHLLKEWHALPEVCVECADWSGKEERRIVHANEILNRCEADV